MHAETTKPQMLTGISARRRFSTGTTSVYCGRSPLSSTLRRANPTSRESPRLDELRVHRLNARPGSLTVGQSFRTQNELTPLQWLPVGAPWHQAASHRPRGQLLG